MKLVNIACYNGPALTRTSRDSMRLSSCWGVSMRHHTSCKGSGPRQREHHPGLPPWARKGRVCDLNSAYSLSQDMPACIYEHIVPMQPLPVPAFYFYYAPMRIVLPDPHRTSTVPSVSCNAQLPFACLPRAYRNKFKQAKEVCTHCIGVWVCSLHIHTVLSRP